VTGAADAGGIRSVVGGIATMRPKAILVSFLFVAAAARGGASAEDFLPREVSSWPDVSPPFSLEEYRWDSQQRYSIVPAYIGVSSDSVNFGLTADMFSLTAYSKHLDANDGRVDLQPILQGASWWSLRAGGASIESAGTTYRGTTYAVEGFVVGVRDLGARVSFERIATDDDSITIETSAFALLYDYAHGGRAGLFFKDYDDVRGAVPSIVVDNTVSYGCELTHVFGIGSFHLAASRQETTYTGVLELGETFDERLTVYPLEYVGFTIHASQVRRDITDSDEYGAGILLDLEQVSVKIEFSRLDDHRTPADSNETWTVAVLLRFW
jgi:hypothetical protein